MQSVGTSTITHALRQRAQTVARLVALGALVAVLGMSGAVRSMAEAPVPATLDVDVVCDGVKPASTASAKVTVRSESGLRVPNVPVSVAWRWLGHELTDTAVTDGSGVAVIERPVGDFPSGTDVVIVARATGAPGEPSHVTRFRPGAVWRVSDTAQAWSWHSSPIAVHHTGAQDRTFFGGVSKAGEVMVTSYDHRTGDTTSTAVFKYPLDESTADDHNNPSILVRSSDGRIIVFWSGHASRTIRWRISTKPEDVTSFGPTRELDNPAAGSIYTYTQAVELTDEGRMYMFCRRNATIDGRARRVWDVNVSTDDGGTFARNDAYLWGQPDVSSPYTAVVSDGKSKIWFARDDWMPGQTSEHRRGIWACYYEGGALHRADASTIATWGALPVADVNTLDRVVNDEGPDIIGTYCKDIQLNADGDPVVLFSVLGTDGRNRFKSASLVSGQWVIADIADAGRSVHPGTAHPHYEGGGTLDSADPRTAYLGREIGVGATRRFVVERWRMSADGASWQREGRLAAPLATSPAHDFRPVIPTNHHPDMGVLWLRGRYRQYTDWDTRVWAAKDDQLIGQVAPPDLAREELGALDSLGGDGLSHKTRGIDLAEGDLLRLRVTTTGGLEAGLRLFEPGCRDIWSDDPIASVHTRSADGTSFDMVVPRGRAGRYVLDMCALSGSGAFILSSEVVPAGSHSVAVPLPPSGEATIGPAETERTFSIWLEPGDEIAASLAPSGQSAPDASLALVTPPSEVATQGVTVAQGGTITHRVPPRRGGAYLLRAVAGQAGSEAVLGTTIRRATTTNVTAPTTTPGIDTPVPLSVSLTDLDDEPVPDAAFRIEYLTSGGSWKLTKTLPAPFGRAVYEVMPMCARTYRALYEGDDNRASSSGSIRIVPKVALSGPRASANAVANKPFSVWGYLRPRHQVGKSSVRVLCFRKVGTAWRLERTISTLNTGTDAVTIWRSTAKLSKGSWKLQAWAQPDAQHTSTYSPAFAYVTVR